MYGFFIFLLFSQQSDAGFSCSKQMMTYQTAIDSCFLENGKPVEISATNKDSIQNEIGNRLSVWTKFYANPSSDCNKFGNIKTVCGYQYYLVNTPDDIKIFEEVRYGDCYGKRNYVCERESHIYRIFKDKFAAATICNFPDLEKWKDKATTEYYWKSYSQTNICLLNANQPIQRDEELPNCLGYVYDIDGGYYYIACSSLRTMLCEFKDDGHVRAGYGACKTVRHTSTTMAKETTTIQINSTQKSEPTNSPVGYTSTTMAKETTTLQTNSTQKSESTNSPDLGYYIGGSVAACVIILFVVFLICYRHRNNGRDENRGEFEDDTVGAISTTNQLQTRNETTATYEAYNNAANDDSVEHVYLSIDEGGNYEII